MINRQTETQTDRKLQVDASRLILFKKYYKMNKKRNAWIYILYIFVVETWILFRENDEVVSNVIQEAYEHYEAMEFGRDRKDIGDPNRHVKLINIAGKKVMFAGFVHKNNSIYDLDELVYLLFILQFHRVYLF